MFKSDLRTPAVRSVENGLLLLEMIGVSTHGLTLSDLVHKSGLPKSSIYALLLTLERRGYLRQSTKTNRFMLDVKAFDLSNHALTRIEIRQVALPYLYGLMQATNLTVHLAVMGQKQAVLIEKMKPPGMRKIASWIGKRMDVHCTGLGKALIANLDERDIDSLISDHGLPRHNENTISSSRVLKAQLAEIRECKYAIDDEEDEIGLRCIGTPIFDRAGKVLAAISPCGTVSDIFPGNLPALAQGLTRTASEISQSVETTMTLPT